MQFSKHIPPSRAIFLTALFGLWAAMVAPAAAGPSCVVPDVSGSTELPIRCPYVNVNGRLMIVDGLAPGTTIEIDASGIQTGGTGTTFGGSLGGPTKEYDWDLTLSLDGTGGLAGFHRDITLLAHMLTDYGPILPGTSPQDFDMDMRQIQGQITGDPDFDLLRITAGTGFGMPSPGHTTLTQLPGGSWAVDSFFDIEYRIDFVGHPGGPLSGHSGSTTATIRLAATTAVPEPTTMGLFGFGLVGLAAWGWRRRNQLD